MGDDELLSRLQQVLAGMGDGGLPPPDAPFYSLGLTSMTTAQFSGFLEQVRVLQLRWWTSYAWKASHMPVYLSAQ